MSWRRPAQSHCRSPRKTATAKTLAGDRIVVFGKTALTHERACILADAAGKCGVFMATMPRRRVAIFQVVSGSNWPRALVTKPKPLLFGEPTDGAQRSIIKDIGRVPSPLRQQGETAILLVEQYFDFARELADRIAVMDRGELILDGATDAIDIVRRHIAV